MVLTKSDQQTWTISPPDREQTPPQFPAPPAFTEEDDRTSTMQQAEYAFPKVGELPIPHLSPLTAHFHLSILQRFCALYDSIESQTPDAEGKAKLVQQFLVCAESRYIRYLALLDDFSRNFNVENQGATNSFLDAMPLPPWDVAIVFHAHCLNPYRFFTDMNRKGLWGKGIAFPLERLFLLMANGVWSDAKSEQMWTGSGKSAPYQLWESDPASGVKLQLQDPRFPCLWCSCTEEIPLVEFCQTHTTKTSICRCRSCGHHFDADTLSAKYLCDDLREFVKKQNGWIVKGAISGVHDSILEETARVDLQIILQAKLMDSSARLSTPQGSSGHNPHLAIYAATATGANWKDINQSIQKTITELKGARLLRMLSRGNIFDSIRTGYMGILWRDLSIDLVAASLRQREFATKITSDECIGIDNALALFRATTRYHKFLLLMKRKSSDLCWHTHQLNAVSYRQWCIEHLEIAVNHDDTVGKESLNTGLRETTIAWFDAYREVYATNDQHKSKGLSIAGVRLLSGGLFSRKGGKSSQASKDNSDRENGQDADKIPPYMSMYPYWLNYPFGWGYPAACANSGSTGGWAASVDQQHEVSTNSSAKCAGCTSGCNYVWGD